MSRMMVFLVIAVVLFSTAAGLSWYYQQQQTTESEEPTATAGEKSGKAPVAKTGAGEVGKRPLILPSNNGDANTAARFSKSLQDQQEAIKVREEQMRVREKQHDLFHVQMLREQKALEETKKGIQVELALVMEKLKLLEEVSAELDRKKKQIARDQKDFDGKVLHVKDNEAVNLKKVAGMYEGMEPEEAAQSIEKMAAKNQIETAASILLLMSTRKSPAVLAEVSKLDPNLAIQLVERIRLASPAGPTVGKKDKQ